ncbi:hypothetical protein [Brevibacillus reuszeri]|uniref:hypothetical protein n=1 Tax=Brevibacillus reuszeri TaxID=54915 RepID=UPI000CCBFA3C|nr:hypothetical protein [Brevibacillus reuszeri]
MKVFLKALFIYLFENGMKTEDPRVGTIKLSFFDIYKVEKHIIEQELTPRDAELIRIRAYMAKSKPRY